MLKTACLYEFEVLNFEITVLWKLIQMIIVDRNCLNNCLKHWYIVVVSGTGNAFQWVSTNSVCHRRIIPRPAFPHTLPLLSPRPDQEVEHGVEILEMNGRWSAPCSKSRKRPTGEGWDKRRTAATGRRGGQRRQEWSSKGSCTRSARLPHL